MRIFNKQNFNGSGQPSIQAAAESNNFVKILIDIFPHQNLSLYSTLCIEHSNIKYLYFLRYFLRYLGIFIKYLITFISRLLMKQRIICSWLMMNAVHIEMPASQRDKT